MPPGDSPFAVKFIIIIRGSNLRYAFSLHQGRAAFSDPLFVVWRCIRGRNPSKTFSTIREKCFAAMECVGMDRKIQKWSHKCYAWRSRTPVPGHNWQRWARTRNGSVRQTTNYWRSGKLSANLAIVLPMKSSTIDMAFIKFVQDGSQNNSQCCINKRVWTPAKKIWIAMKKVTPSYTESSLVTKQGSNITSRNVNGRVWNGNIHNRLSGKSSKAE